MKKIMKKFAVTGTALCVLCGCVKDSSSKEEKTAGYDFTEYELMGDWTEYGTEDPMTLTISKDTVAWKDNAGTEGKLSFVLGDSDSVRRRTLSLGGEDAPFESLLFRMIDVDGWSTDCLFVLGEDGAAERVFVKDSDAGLLPAGYIPAPDDGEKEEDTVTEEPDREQLTKEFREALYGNWTEIQAGDPWYAFFDEKTVTWIHPDGMEDTVEYSLDRYPLNNLYREVRPASVDGSYGFLYLIARKKVIDGHPLYVLFGVNEMTGTTETDIAKVFVRDSDLQYIPAGYTVDYDTDNDFLYTRPDLEETLFVKDAMETVSWLGKAPAETGAAELYFKDGETAFNGYLFGKKVHGTARCDTVFDDITMYSYALDYDDCAEQLKALYGEGEPFEEPYVAGTGAVTGINFLTDDVRVTVSMGSEQSFLQISFISRKK